MGDVEARMVAAGEQFNVGSKQFTLRPITIQHLCDLERQSIRHFKRECLQTFKDGFELLGNGKGEELLLKKVEEIASWGIDDLPKKDAYDVQSVPVNDQVRQWIKETYDDVPKEDKACLAVLSNSLSTGRITLNQIKDMTGIAPLHGRIRYDMWWVTGSYEGMIEFCYSSVHYEHPEVTREEVSQWPLTKVIEAASMVEKLTIANLGNM